LRVERQLEPVHQQRAQHQRQRFIVRLFGARRFGRHIEWFRGLIAPHVGIARVRADVDIRNFKCW